MSCSNLYRFSRNQSISSTLSNLCVYNSSHCCFIIFLSLEVIRWYTLFPSWYWSSVFSLSLFFFFLLVSLARGLSVWLIFSKNQLFVLVVFSVVFLFPISFGIYYFHLSACFGLISLFSRFLRWKLETFSAVNFPLGTTLAMSCRF